MSNFDSNTWYQMTETRVGFNSSYYIGGSNDTYFYAQNSNNTATYWQIFHLTGDTYQIRNNASGIASQFSVCYVAAEKDTSKTQPCFRPSDGNTTQQWNVSPWGDGTFKIYNIANGSNYNLDVHPGNPPFMSSNLTQPQVAQHWEFQAIDSIDDARFSTTVTEPLGLKATATPTAVSTGASTATTTPTSSSTSAASSSGLSAGAQAGIGVGVAIGVLLLFALLFGFLWRRRRANKTSGDYAAVNAAGTTEGRPAEMAATPAGALKSHEMYSSHGAAGELAASPAYTELPGSQPAVLEKYGHPVVSEATTKPPR